MRNANANPEGKRSLRRCSRWEDNIGMNLIGKYGGKM
jgi:hypothetical protein